MSRKAKTQYSIEYEQIYSEIRSKRLPLLTIDNGWHNLFSEGKTKEIERLEKELNDALKGQGKINDERQGLLELKHTLLQQIVENMNADDERTAKKMAKSRDLIEEINDKLVLIEDRELDLPSTIRDANANLLMATMDRFCRKALANEREIEELEAIIDRARIEIKKKILQKEEKAEENEIIYKYLDKTVGRGIVDKYERYLKERE